MAHKLAIVSVCDTPRTDPLPVDNPYVHAWNLTSEGQWSPLRRHLLGFYSNLYGMREELEDLLKQSTCPTLSEQYFEMLINLEKQMSTVKCVAERLGRYANNTAIMNKARETMQNTWAAYQARYRNNEQIMLVLSSNRQREVTLAASFTLRLK